MTLPNILGLFTLLSHIAKCFTLNHELVRIYTNSLIKIMQNKNFGIYAKVENSSYLTCIDRSTVRSVIAAALKKYVKCSLNNYTVAQTVSFIPEVSYSELSLV